MLSWARQKKNLELARNHRNMGKVMQREISTWHYPSVCACLGDRSMTLQLYSRHRVSTILDVLSGFIICNNFFIKTIFIHCSDLIISSKFLKCLSSLQYSLATIKLNNLHVDPVTPCP